MTDDASRCKPEFASHYFADDAARCDCGERENRSRPVPEGWSWEEEGLLSDADCARTLELHDADTLVLGLDDGERREHVPLGCIEALTGKRLVIDLAHDVPAPTLRDDGSCYVVAYTDVSGVQQEHFHGSLEEACDDFRARTVEAVIRRFVPDEDEIRRDERERWAVVLEALESLASPAGPPSAWAMCILVSKRMRANKLPSDFEEIMSAARAKTAKTIVEPQDECEHDWEKSGPNGVVRTCRKCGEETLL